MTLYCATDETTCRTILAMAPGKREFGIAVFDDSELVYFALRSLRHKRSRNALKNETIAILRKLIELYEPRKIALKAVSQYQKNSSNVAAINEAICQQAAVRQIPVAKISLERIKAALCDDEIRTQKRAFQSLTVIYPELRQYLNRPNKWQSDYYHNLFSAVAAGVAVLKSRAR